MSSRVRLPSGVRPPFAVYVNGVPQELGRDYRISQGELRFTRDLHSAEARPVGVVSRLLGDRDL